jgi:nucleoporin GLE1
MQRGQIRNIFRAAWSNRGILVDARQFIINPSQPFPENVDTQVSGVFVYVINVLIKAAMKLMPTSASNLTYNAVDPIGVVLTFIVSLSEFRIHGNSFADIYLAKYHKACPPLFGLWGREETQEGRVRLGWVRDKDDGSFMGSQLHYDRLNGLASGFAAITLRDFSRTREINALPAWHYWRALASIMNVPPAELTKTHSVIVRAMIDQYANHFVKFYGHAAIAALRLAVITRPDQAPEKAGFGAVKVVRDNLKTNFGLEI